MPKDVEPKDGSGAHSQAGAPEPFATMPYYQELGRRLSGQGVDGILQFLVGMATVSDQNKGSESFPYRSISHFILKEGIAFEAKSLPPDVKRGFLKQCFFNSRAISVRRKSRYAYCEGFATPGFAFPVHHAWLLDLKDGKVIDPTWSHDDRGIERGAFSYLGVVIDHAFVMETFKRSGCVLEDWKGGFPILTGGAGDRWRHSWMVQKTENDDLLAGGPMQP
jgi:hypothetical protein